VKTADTIAMERLWQTSHAERTRKHLSFFLAFAPNATPVTLEAKAEADRKQAKKQRKAKQTPRVRYQRLAASLSARATFAAARKMRRAS
jgi:hypothetical protein